MNITITKELTTILPNFNIYAFSMDVKVENSKIIESKIKELEQDIPLKYTLEDILQIPSIKNARDGYKKLGKDPSRYRLACESLFRRLVKNKGLYFVNNVVDAGNVLSIELAKSTAVLDYDNYPRCIVLTASSRIGNSSILGNLILTEFASRL